MIDPGEPSRSEFLRFTRERRNWGRWGDNDQRGAINLITPEKRVRAAQLVRSGRIVSLSRDFPKRPGPGNPVPAQHFLTVDGHPKGGAATDYYGISYHGYQATHIDALCHIWTGDGVYGGRTPQETFGPREARWCGIEHWRDGIVTRGVLLDIPRLRGEPHVTPERPVLGRELEEAARRQGVTLEPGDALAVFSGRGSYEAATPDWNADAGTRPGLEASCLFFIREQDVSVLAWDLQDNTPSVYNMLLPVHRAIDAFGVALIDNCLLEPLAAACAEEGRYEFMLSVGPLAVVGGTGSPVNPIALF